MDDVERSDDKAGAGPLFSRSAPDNVEVVAGASARRDAGLWSVSAKDAPEGTVASGARSDRVPDTSALWDETDGDDLWDLIEDDNDPRLATFPPPPFGQPYKSPLADNRDAVPPSGSPAAGRWPEWSDSGHDTTSTSDDVDRPTSGETYTVDETYVAEPDVVDDTTFAGYEDDDVVYEGSIIDETPLGDDPVSYMDDNDTIGYPSGSYEDTHTYSNDPHEQNAAGSADFTTGADSHEAGSHEAGSYETGWSEEGSYETDSHEADAEDVHGDHGQYAYEEQQEAYRTAGASGDLHDTVGSLFRAEPVERNYDVIDSVDDVDADPYEDILGTSPFSSGMPADGSAIFGEPSPSDAPGGSGGPAFVAGRARNTFEPASGGFDPVGEAGTPGFIEAIEALDPEDRSRARTVLVVVGALLGQDEQVIGLVVGQMLGHPAVLALTRSRVLVVNDRPWQPVVDEYSLNDELEIRGRHDRNMAAIGLGDGEQLSMVDGVRDVGTAIDLVEQIRTLAGVS